MIGPEAYTVALVRSYSSWLPMMLRRAVAIEVVRLRALQRARLPGDFGAELEFVRAGARHGVDDAAGGAAELDRVAAGLDLELLVERVRHGRGADAVVEVRDVEAVDVDGVLGDRRAAERHAADAAKHRSSSPLVRPGASSATESRSRSTGRRSRSSRVTLVADSVDFTSTAVTMRVPSTWISSSVDRADRYVRRRRGAECHRHVGELAEHRAVLGRFDLVLADRQEREAIVAVRVGLHRAREPRCGIAHGHFSIGQRLVARVGEAADQRAVAGGVRNRCRQRSSERHPHRDIHRALQKSVVHATSRPVIDY